MPPVMLQYPRRLALAAGPSVRCFRLEVHEVLANAQFPQEWADSVKTLVSTFENLAELEICDYACSRTSMYTDHILDKIFRNACGRLNSMAFVCAERHPFERCCSELFFKRFGCILNHLSLSEKYSKSDIVQIVQGCPKVSILDILLNEETADASITVCYLLRKNLAVLVCAPVHLEYHAIYNTTEFRFSKVVMTAVLQNEKLEKLLVRKVAFTKYQISNCIVNCGQGLCELNICGSGHLSKRSLLDIVALAKHHCPKLMITSFAKQLKEK